MEIVLVIFGVVALITLYDYFTTKNWQSLTSATRNEAVFENRNKEYGAYTLRRDYNKNMLLVMLGVVCTLGLMSFSFLYGKNNPDENKALIVDDFDTTIVVVEKLDDKIFEPEKPEQAKVESSDNALKNIEPIIIDDFTGVDVPTQDDFKDKNAGLKTGDDEENWDETIKETGTGKLPCSDCIEKKDSTYSNISLTLDPEFVGNLEMFIQKTIIYPQTAIERDAEGTCYIKFVINADGTVSNLEIERGIPNCPECDTEAKRVLKKMPNWKAGEINGKKVKSYVRQPINFTLN